MGQFSIGDPGHFCIGTNSVSAEEFNRAIKENQSRGNEAAIDASPIAEAVIRLANEGPWEGTSSDLLALLRSRVDEQTRRRLPKSARGLSGAMKRLTPVLEEQGIFYREAREGGSGSRKKALGRVDGAYTAAPKHSMSPELFGTRAAELADSVL